MATKKKDTGLGRSGFFEDTPAAPQAPSPLTPPSKEEPTRRTTIMLSPDDLDLIVLLKRYYRRQGETITQSELCARGLRLLAEHNGMKA